MYVHQTQIFLHHTDAAGRLFFANQFFLMHEALEKMLDSINMPIHRLLDHPELTFPLVHAEADYKSILVAGDRVKVEVAIEKIGNSSVTVAYRVLKMDGTLAGTGKTVSVCVDLKTNQAVPVPEDWREKLAKMLIKK